MRELPLISDTVVGAVEQSTASTQEGCCRREQEKNDVRVLPVIEAACCHCTAHVYKYVHWLCDYQCILEGDRTGSDQVGVPTDR